LTAGVWTGNKKALSLNTGDKASKYRRQAAQAAPKRLCKYRQKGIATMKTDVINHYDALIDEGNDPFFDSPFLQEYMESPFCERI
jgi:hypothetical protein